LLLRPEFIEANEESLRRIAGATGSTGLLLGFVGRSEGWPGRELTNAAALCHRGQVVAVRAKTLLPTYDVFDEDRYFEPAAENAPVDFGGARLGVTICEDIWNDGDFWRHRRYRRDPAAELAAAGASVLVNLSASPWHLGKDQTRLEMLRSLARKTQLPVVYCNLVGGNDELVFDGGSLVLNSKGDLLARGARFAEDHLLVDLAAAPAAEPASAPPEAMVVRGRAGGRHRGEHPARLRGLSR
jgi:NAD+ synthase (glutamine-hydrolysing)